jgi:hypothetical protein
MSQSNTQINIHKLTSEQRQQLFLALFIAEPSLLNVLNTEQRRQLYAVLMAIDPSLSLDTRSAVHGITNEQACLLIFTNIYN